MAIGFAQAKVQSQQAFFEGTAYATLNGSPRGRDTINARINEGEAVIPTATNAKYKSSILGIYGQTVPASLLNSVTEAYQNGSLDMSKIQGAKLVGFSNAEKNSIGLVVNSGSRMNEKRIVQAVERVVDAVLSKREVNITERGIEYVATKRMKKRVLNSNKFK